VLKFAFQIDHLYWHREDVLFVNIAQAVRGKAMRISKEGGRIEVFAIPTNEELRLARDAVRVVKDVERLW